MGHRSDHSCALSTRYLSKQMSKHKCRVYHNLSRNLRWRETRISIPNKEKVRLVKVRTPDVHLTHRGHEEVDGVDKCLYLSVKTPMSSPTAGEVTQDLRIPILQGSLTEHVKQRVTFHFRPVRPTECEY